MFRGILGEIAAAADPGTEADKVGVFGSLLSEVSALAGHNPHVPIGNTRHPLLIWTLLIGRTATGRKGEATGTASRVVREANPEVYGIEESGLSSGEGLVERIRDPDDEEDQGGTMDKRLLVVETEMATVMAACGREGSKLPGILRQAWDGDRLSLLNRKRIVASQSHIAIIGHITPREFRAKLRDSDMAGGTWNRYLPLYVERRKLLPLPAGLDAAELTALSKSLGAAIERARRCTAVTLDRDAAELWQSQLYREFTEFDEDTSAADFVQRAAPYCRRIAALFAALDGRGQAATEDLAAAAHLIRYSIASARYVLDPAPRDVSLDKLRRAVDEAGMAGLTRDDAVKLFSGHVSKSEMDDLIGRLTSDGSYAAQSIPTGGRPKTVLRAARKARKARLGDDLRKQSYPFLAPREERDTGYLWPDLRKRSYIASLAYLSHTIAAHRSDHDAAEPARGTQGPPQGWSLANAG